MWVDYLPWGYMNPTIGYAHVGRAPAVTIGLVMTMLGTTKKTLGFLP